MKEQQRDLWEWIVKNLEAAIDWAKNRNSTLRKFIRFYTHEDTPNVGLSDNDQEWLDNLKLPDFMENEKSKSSMPGPNPSGSSTNYKKPAVEIPPVDIDRLHYRDFSEVIQPGPSTTSNKPNTCSYTKNFDKFDFHFLSPINSSASKKANFDTDSMVSDYFHTSYETILQPPRQWWKVDPSDHI
jgi:hypothetical protein